jgi:GT2 family glycosyltransferase
MNNLTASIVAYKNDAAIIAHAIHSFLRATSTSKLFLIDNSPTDDLKYLAYDPRIIYIFNKKNVGFGAGHNIALKQILETSKYHLILNPDVYFDDSVIDKLLSFMDANDEIGQVMPKVLYPDGQLQRLCKLLPSPQTLVMRRFFNFLTSALEKKNFYYEFQFTSYDQIMDVPFLSGCFMFLRTEALKKTGLFDERFFLYTEDTDLTRRIHRHYRTVFFPDSAIYHHHQRGSYKEPWLLWCNIQSAIRYFNKWGWFNDLEREAINRTAILKLGL